MTGGLVGSGVSGIADLMAGMACQGHEPPEFGWLRTPNLYLEVDSMPGVLIPPYGTSDNQDPGGYRVVGRLRGGATRNPSFAAPEETRLAEGDRVFVSWSYRTPVVQQHREPEFGTLDGALNLVPDSMPSVLVADYRVLKVLVASAIATTGTAVGDHGTHTHLLPAVGLQAGDRVFICWDGATPVIVGSI